jgi:hypothetical protein
MSNNALRTEMVRKAVSVDSVGVSKFQKEGSLTAQMRQVIEKLSWYQAKQSANSNTNSLYDNDDFGEEYQDKPYTATENRIAFILVPTTASVESVTKKLNLVVPRNHAIINAMKAEGVTETFDLAPETLEAIAKEFETRVDRLPEAAHLTDPCIYKVLSNHPILSTSQKYSISVGQKTLDDIADKQVVRYPKEDELAGNIITDANGKVQYKATFFSEWHVEDEDRRTKDLSDVYLTKALKIELGETVTPVNDEQYMESQVDSQGQTA